MPEEIIKSYYQKHCFAVSRSLLLLEKIVKSLPRNPFRPVVELAVFLDLYFDLGLDGFALLLSLSRFGLHLLGSGSLMVGACSGPARWLDNRELATQFVDFSNLLGVCNNSTTIVTTRWSQLLFIVRRCYRCTARDVSINVHSVLMPLHTADVQPRGPEASNHSSLFIQIEQ